MNAAFQKAASPERFRVLGKELLPFSIGHEKAFVAIDSPFSVDSESIADATDLFLAVWICSQEPTRCVESILSPVFIPRVHCWARWRALCGYEEEAEFKKFFDYLNHYRVCPEPLPKAGQSDSIPFGSPLAFRMQARLISLGYSPDAALRAHYGDAAAIMAAHSESKGDYQIVESLEALRAESIRLQPEIIAKCIAQSKAKSSQPAAA